MTRSLLSTLLVAAAVLLMGVPLADAAPPDISITSGPATTTNSTSANFVFGSTAPTATFECDIDAGGFAACTSPHPLSGLAEGPHTFQVRATDAGETSAPASFSWTIDVTPPAAPGVSTGPSGPTNDATPTFTFTPIVTATTYHCSIDNPAPNVVCAGFSFTSGALADGAHTFYVTATDAAGNTSTTPSSRTFTVDTTPPTSPTVSATGTTNDSTPTFTFTAVATATAYNCSIDNPAPNVACAGLSFTSSALPDGLHTFYVTATDAAGNTSTPGSGSFTVDTTAPDTNITTTIPATIATTTLSIAFTATGGATSFECKLDAGAFAACTSPANLTGLTDGSHTFSVRASDGIGNVDPTPATATWSVAATGPGSGGPGGPALSGPGNLTVEANGPAGTIVTFVVSGSDGGLALLPGAVSCSPSSGTRFPLGSTSVACHATGAGGTVGSLSFSITVVDTTAPVINAPNASFAATSARGLARTDPAIAAYLSGISASDLVSSVTLTTTTPETLPIGKTTITVTARDAAGNTAQKTVTLTVVSPGTALLQPDLIPPAAVRRLTAKPGDKTIVLTWTKPAVKDLASIKVIRSIVGQKGTTTVYNGLRNTFTSRGLRNGVVYRFVVMAIDRAGNTSKSVVVTGSPAAPALASPQAGARVATAPSLRWARVPTTKYYNVQLYRNSTKVLSAWPATTHLQLTRTWSYGGKTYTLKPGRYTWYVWPGVGGRAAAVYGPLLGKSTFVVTPVKV